MEGADPRDRREALRRAEELLARAEALAGEPAQALLLEAADLYRGPGGDLALAAATLRRARSAGGPTAAVMGRLIQVAEARGDWVELADALQDVARSLADDDARAQLVARRADVLALRIGRLAEARGLYREVARITGQTRLREAARLAAERIDRALSERPRSGARVTLDLEPVAEPPPAVAPERSPASRAPSRAAAEPLDPAEVVERALSAFRARLAAAPGDDNLLVEALCFGARALRLDAARVLLPDATPEARAARVEELATGAAAAHDVAAAEALSALAFLDRPDDLGHFQAALGLSARGGEELRRSLLLARMRATRDDAERRALAFELGSGTPWPQVERDAAHLAERPLIIGAEDEPRDLFRTMPPALVVASSEWNEAALEPSSMLPSRRTPPPLAAQEAPTAPIELEPSPPPVTAWPPDPSDARSLLSAGRAGAAAALLLADPAPPAALLALAARRLSLLGERVLAARCLERLGAQPAPLGVPAPLVDGSGELSLDAWHERFAAAAGARQELERYLLGGLLLARGAARPEEERAYVLGLPLMGGPPRRSLGREPWRAWPAPPTEAFLPGAEGEASAQAAAEVALALDLSPAERRAIPLGSGGTPARRARFWAARAAARALGAEDAQADRAGLVVCGDPRLALEEVGAEGARGRALAAFALGGALAEAWAQLGYALARPNTWV